MKGFGRSTDKRIEENSNEMFRYYLHSIANKCFKDKYRHGGMIWTKYLLKRKNTLHQAGSSAVTYVVLEREEKRKKLTSSSKGKRKRKKEKWLQHGVFRLRVVHLSLSPSSEMRKINAKKNGRARSWGQEAREKQSLFKRASRPQDLTCQFFSVAGFFRVSLDGLSERWTTSLNTSCCNHFFLFSTLIFFAIEKQRTVNESTATNLL